MKAMVLTGPNELKLDEVAKPAAGRDVLVKVTHSGICGTDYKIFNGSIPVRYPRIMGHEMAGEVVDAGDSTLRVGEREYRLGVGARDRGQFGHGGSP